MLAKTVAALLVVLTLLPFTAPFSTCDLATLVGGTLPEPAPGNHPRSLTSSRDRSISQVRPLVRSAGRLRPLALSGPGALNAVSESINVMTVDRGASAVSAALASGAVLRI